MQYNIHFIKSSIETLAVTNVANKITNTRELILVKLLPHLELLEFIAAKYD